MPNTNPIQINKHQVLTDFSLGTAPDDAAITLTIAIDLAETGWKYQPVCVIFLDEDDIYPAGSPEPANLFLAKAGDIRGHRLLVKSDISKILPAGGQTGANPSIHYSLMIKADGVALDTFKVSDGNTVSSDFNSLIQFS